MAQGGRGLPQEAGGDPLDLLDAGNSRAMVKRAAKHGASKAHSDDDDDRDFIENDEGMMMIRVRPLAVTQALSFQSDKQRVTVNIWRTSTEASVVQCCSLFAHSSHLITCVACSSHISVAWQSFGASLATSSTWCLTAQWHLQSSAPCMPRWTVELSGRE